MKEKTVLKYVSDIRGLGQTYIANLVGLKSETVHKWFVGSKPISKKHKEIIEQLTGFNVDFLQNKLTQKNKIIVLEREIERVKSSDQ